MKDNDNTNGKLLGHVPCPIHGSTDSLALYEKTDGSIDGYCWSECGYVPSEVLLSHDVIDESNKVIVTFATKPSNNSVNFEMTDELMKRLESVKTDTSNAGWKERNITTATTKRYGTRTKMNDENVVTHRYYPSTLKGELVGYHVRDDLAKQHNKLKKGKKKQPFFPIGNVTTNAELFGQAIFPKSGKFVVIAEGEEDAMAIYQSMKSDAYETAVVSPTTGSRGAIPQIRSKRNYEWLKSFQRIVIFPDNDDAGKLMADEIRKIFGADKVYIAELNGKDACEVLLLPDGAKQIRDAFWRAVPNTPSSVVTVDDVFDRAMKLPEMGLSLPWPTLTKETLGLRRGEIYVVGSAPKIGKTEFQHQLIKHMTEVHSEKVGVMSLEESPVKTAKKVAGKYARKQFTKPPEVGGYTLEELRDGLEHIRGKIEFYSSEGERDIDQVLDTARYWASQGIWLIIIDPLTALIAEHSASEANDLLNKFMSKASSMAMELGITFFLFTHVNPPKSGTPHDRGGDVLSSQFTGSRALEKWAHYGIGIQRDRYEENPIKRNTARITMLFDREFGQYCEYFCYYDSEHNDWYEVEEVHNGVSPYVDAKEAFDADEPASTKVIEPPISESESTSYNEDDDWDIDLGTE